MIYSTLAERAAAAVERSSRVRARADRPSHRRNASDPQARASVTFKVRNLEIRSAGSDGMLGFSGYASVTDTPYDMWDWYGPYTEQVSSGAFGQTLAQDGLDVPLVLGHDPMRRIARTTNGTLQLSEDSTGCLVQAQLDPNDHDVQYIAPKLANGLIDEMSFKFSITKGTWSPDYTEYHIEGVDLHRGDVAIVGYGANPFTAGSGLQPADGGELAAVHPRRTGLTADSLALWLD